MTPDRYSGDPRILITPQGWDLDYNGGQPTMDQGLENQALISLFTRKGWCGNFYLDQTQQIGSDFLSTASGDLTLKSVTSDIPQAALLALASDLLPDISVAVVNPNGWDLQITITLDPGTALVLDRRGMLWKAQAQNPASARLVATS